MATQRVIKRYENRKLYDTETRQYIRLTDIARLVREGQEVAVIDNSTGSDITAQTLSKIIAEEGPSRPALSVESLHQLLRRGAQSATAGWEQLQKGINRRVQDALEQKTPLREMREEITRLKARIRELEESLSQYELEVTDGSNDDGGDGSESGRKPDGEA
ncbi:MAG: polyhydroxyalkanoate synthesis regulator DNA-binding domain-containing protein [Bryobacteraceae bacterium]|nr:polyhydroxyalkanoate synthesis regulator DNA-binding domain-containing protein [Bryobacteraceae bacterium]